MEAKKIVHVHFKYKSIKESDFYFGSISAIYDTFTDEDLGITYASLCAALRNKRPYENRKVVVNIGEIQRKKKSIS